MQTRGSIGEPAVRWLTMRRSTTTSASAQAVSMSPPPIDHSCVWLVPSDSWQSCEPSARASSGSQTTGSGSYSTKTCSAASTTPYLLSPMTTATAWPTYLTSPRASGQSSGVLTSTPGGTQAIGIGEARSCRSSPVKTPWTPSYSLAADVSIEVMFACASVERMTAMYSIPERTMSST